MIVQSYKAYGPENMEALMNWVNVVIRHANGIRLRKAWGSLEGALFARPFFTNVFLPATDWFS